LFSLIVLSARLKKMITRPSAWIRSVRKHISAHIVDLSISIQPAFAVIPIVRETPTFSVYIS
ncbi:MAG: hypothetical protein WC568_08965, partial [Candidatus Methanoperedens sp.]